MRGYYDISRSTTACVHFVFEEGLDDSFMKEITDQLRQTKVSTIYLDGRELEKGISQMCRAVGLAIGAEHADGCMEDSYVSLFDDMITLSKELAGLVIVIDWASDLFDADRSTVLGFIEAFLAQINHWIEKEKPCHLCFQLSPNEDVRKYFLDNLS